MKRSGSRVLLRVKKENGKEAVDDVINIYMQMVVSSCDIKRSDVGDIRLIE